LVIGLVALLAAAIVVPAVAQTQTPTSFLGKLAQAAIPFGGPAWSDTPLGFFFAPPDNNDDIIEPIVSNSESPGFSSSSSNPSVSGSSSSDPSVSSSSSSDPSVSSSSSSTNDPDPSGVSQEFSQRRIQSGSASPSSSFSNSGDNVNACPTTQQVVNTGNVTNQQGVSQYNTDTDDISFEGSNITITPDQTSTCTQTIDQAAAGK
jgi:hypothetical protein